MTNKLMKRSKNIPKHPFRLSRLVPLLGLSVFVLSAPMMYAAGHLARVAFDSEALSAGHFPSQDGWTIDEANRTGGFVEVTGYGLDYQIPEGGAPVDGGTKAIALNGSPATKLDNFLTYTSTTPLYNGTDDLYFGMTFEAEDLGTAADPHELFLRLDGWTHYVAVKLYSGAIEIAGTAPVSFAAEGTEALAGVVHHVVGRISTDDDGNITAFDAWLNPGPDDMGTPTISAAKDGSQNIDSIDTIELRSQNNKTVVDNLSFATSWEAVVPPLPADPGDLVVSLPADADETAEGVQLIGGTLFVEVDGAAYEAETILPIGTEVTFRAVPDTANDYVLTGFQGWKGPRGSVQPLFDFKDASFLAEPVDTELAFTLTITEPLSIEPIFEFGEHRIVFSEEMPFRGYRIRLDGSSPNELRTLFDTGEEVSIRAINRVDYTVVGWSGELESVEGGTANLVAGTGVFVDELFVKAEADMNVRESLILGTADVIDPKDGVEFEATELGAAGSVPLDVMNAVVAAKAPQGLAGVADFETLLGAGDLLYDPSPNADTTVPELELVRDEDGNALGSESTLQNAASLLLEIGEAQVRVRPGPQGYVEAGGRDNLADASGPGAPSVGDELRYFDGEFLGHFSLSPNPGSNRTPTSGDVVLGGMTSWDFAFEAADKVTMSGIVYLSRGNFQHTNEDGSVTLWAQARYSDGSVSTLLSSDKLDAPGFGSGGGEKWDHFFGFEAPAGSYLTGIHVWHRGGNNRSFTNMDDLVVVLEGEESYTVAASASPEGAGTVSGGGDYADGSTVSLSASAGADALFVNWEYAGLPGVSLGSETSLDLNVHGPLDIVANFAPVDLGSFETLNVGAIDGQALWSAPEQAEVFGIGLSHTTGDGTVIDGGMQNLLLNGAPDAKMNDWATSPIEAPTETVYFRYLFFAEDAGTPDNPGELFVRMPGWGLYTAAKYADGLIELPGGNQLVVDAENGLPTGMVHMLVGRLNVEDGTVTSIDAWLNPAYADAGSPALSAEVSVPASSVNEVQIRSQNTQIWIDELVFGDAWGDVVPRGLNRDFDSEALSAGHFPSQDGWMIDEANRTGGFVEVTGYGLDYQVPEGAPIDGGTKAIALNGAPSPSQDEWLTNEVDTPAAGVSDLYFGMTFEADTIGVPDDPHELFLRLDGWGAYVAVKLQEGLLEVSGADAVSFAEAGTEALAGVTHRVVGKLGVDEDGFITSISAWLNPEPGDLGTPVVEGTLDGSVNVSEITTIELRSQKTRTVIDDLVFGTSWNQVVPPLPADPGDLVVSLPADADETAEGVQLIGGTLFVEVDGAAYEAETILPIGTEVTFRAVPDTANDYVLTGFQGWKGPRGSVQPLFDFKDASFLAEPVDTELAFTLTITEPLSIEPIFEFGEHRIVFSEEMPFRGYRIRLDGSSPNELRTLFDTGEEVSIRAINRVDYTVVGWSGELESVEGGTANLVAGTGVFVDELFVKAEADMNVRESLILGTADVIDPKDGVEFEATELGAAGSVPLDVMNAVVAAKAPQGLAGVADFETLLGAGDLLYDPSPNADTTVPELELVRDEDGNALGSESTLQNAASLLLEIGEAQVRVRPGPQGYVEAGGRDNLADASGPGAPSVGDELRYFDGEFLGHFSLSPNPGSNRTPTSGDVVLGGMTSWDFAFEAADKVTMSGIVYLSRGNFQHTNEDGSVTLWAQARYSDGSVSTLLSSDKLDAPGFGSGGGEKWDHFFGFEAPAGSYLTGIHVWHRGGNNRSFTNMDDLVVVLEGEESYTVAAASSDEAAGTVTGGGDFADGTVAGLSAEAIGTSVFSHWSYELAPDVVIGTDPSLNLVVHGPVSVIGNFGEANIDPEDRTVPASGGDHSVAVNVAAATEWTAESMASWITITDGEDGTGPGSVAYTVDVYEGIDARTGTILVAGFTHAVTQEGIPDPSFAQIVEGVDLGDGVFHSPWFGRYQTSEDEDWMNHSEQGWLWTAEVSTGQGMWLYSIILESWAWSNADVYPIMYEAAGERYVYYIVVAEGVGVMLFDYSTGEWEMLTP